MDDLEKKVAKGTHRGILVAVFDIIIIFIAIVYLIGKYA